MATLVAAVVVAEEVVVRGVKAEILIGRGERQEWRRRKRTEPGEFHIRARSTRPASTNAPFLRPRCVWEKKRSEDSEDSSSNDGPSGNENKEGANDHRCIMTKCSGVKLRGKRQKIEAGPSYGTTSATDVRCGPARAGRAPLVLTTCWGNNLSVFRKSRRE